ncbi:MAG: hypothetical protein ACQERC_06925 [Bacteroidota bacterium]
MKGIYLCFIVISAFIMDGYGQTSYSQKLSCHTGTFALGYAQQNPTADSLSNIGNFTMEATFLKRHFRFFNTSFGIVTNFGSKSFDRVIEDIEFQGGYTGYASYNIQRFDVWGKYLIGAQFGKVVEVAIPLKVGFRTTGYRQEFDLYEGQEISEEDAVDEEEASEENNDAFARSNKLGFGTGINLAFFPNSTISPFFEMGYNYFGATELPLPDQASISNGDITVPNISLTNNSEMTFRIGVRFNIGCPPDRTSVYRQPQMNSRSVAINRHPEVKTKIVKKNVDTRNNSESEENSEGESENVILKPNKPTRKPQDR